MKNNWKKIIQSMFLIITCFVVFNTFVFTQKRNTENSDSKVVSDVATEEKVVDVTISNNEEITIIDEKSDNEEITTTDEKSDNEEIISTTDETCTSVEDKEDNHAILNKDDDENIEICDQTITTDNTETELEGSTEKVDFDLIMGDMCYIQCDSGDYYILETELKVISGWAIGVENIEKFTYTIEDEKNVLCSGNIEITENWCINNIGFGTGYNLLRVIGEVKDGKIEKEYIIINSNIDNVLQLGIDIYSDSDKDNVPDYFEKKMSLNYLNEDTDGDGLKDYIEIFIPNISPISNDGDQNGIMDQDEDYDGDGLSNYDEECIYYTDLSVIDTDNDGINDFDEVTIYRTNPNEIDTDGDKLDDFWEVTIDSSPLIYDEKFSYTKKMESDNSASVLEVTVTDIMAEQVKTFSINRVNNDEFLNVDIPGYIDQGYEFNIEGTFGEAMVEISGEFEITEEFRPALYYFNEETQILEYVNEQTISDGKLVAVLEHFSKYILLNQIEFDKIWTYTFLYNENIESYLGLDVAFVIDSSRSMSWNDAKYIRRDVVKDFISKLSDDDAASIISFETNAVVLSDFTSDKEILYNAVSQLYRSGGTNISKGIETALNLFDTREKLDDRLRYIILLTDGVGDYSTTHTIRAIEENIVINTIGLGNNVSQTVLTNMAEETGGNYYHIDQAEELHYIFDNIADKVDYYKDSDNDGLSDYYEKEMSTGRLVLGTGVQVQANYLDADSDDDGLLDGEEIEVFKYSNIVYVKLYSNPKKIDTDNDGLNDNIDNLPLISNNISELLIHQTESGEGLMKKTDFSENIVAEDLTFNDYSYTEIVGTVGAAGLFSGVSAEFMMWVELTDLFLLGCASSDLDMSLTLLDMLDEFRYGNVSNIGKTVALNDEFETEKYNRFSDYTLTERAKNYSEFDTYLNEVKDAVIYQLERNDGNLLVLESNGPKDGLIYDMAYEGGLNYPVFSLKKDVALVLAIHDFQGHNITITDYTCDGKTFSGVLQFHFYDHFGLDSDDYEWAPGFCDWFMLQHYDRFDGKYSPYITVIDVSIDFSGEIK